MSAQTVGETLLEAQAKVAQAADLVGDAALLVARCKHAMANAPMDEAGDAVLAVEKFRRVMDGIASLVRAVGGGR